MKRHTVISALAIAATAGSTLAVSAAGWGNGQRMNAQGGQMDGQMGRMSTDVARGPQFDFDGADGNGDGKVTQAELDAYRQVWFDSIDADESGTLDAAELAEHRKMMREEQLKQTAAAMIARRDANGDGVLSADEFGPNARVGLVGRLDADGDGAISRDELAAAQQNFAQRGGMKGQRGMGGQGGHGGMRGQGGQGGMRN